MGRRSSLRTKAIFRRSWARQPPPDPYRLRQERSRSWRSSGPVTPLASVRKVGRGHPRRVSARLLSAKTALCRLHGALPHRRFYSVIFACAGLRKGKRFLFQSCDGEAMNTNAANSSDPALRNLDALLPDLSELYKDVHSHPE